MSGSRNRMMLLAGSSLPMILAFTMPAPQGAAAKAPAKPPVKAADGKTLFASQCAPCHGNAGKGGPAYRKPLTGHLTAAELGKFIAANMPPGGKTPPAQATSIAAYMHGAFYSAVAQERNQPVRVTLARLTVRQFRNAVADLVTGPNPTVPGDAGGLAGEYYKDRDFSEGNRVAQTTDATVDRDFGTTAPIADKMDAHNFSIAWSGSLYAPETGDYDLIIQTDQSARLWFNNAPKPAVDAWVKSGKDTEFRTTVSLLGGRAYALRLEFSKATQGVNDDKTRKATAPGPAFVRLMWRRPKSADQVIDGSYLYSKWSPPVYVSPAAFPPDDRSMGYERGNAVNKSWDDAVTAAALDAAETIGDDLPRYTGIANDDKERDAKLRKYAEAFVVRAFRRPLDEPTRAMYIDRQFGEGRPVETAIKRVVLMTLKSPRFLYREIGGKADGYTRAANLAFGLWDTLPDWPLLAAAGSGELDRPDGIQQQANRLADDPRAWAKLRDFLMLWLKVDEVPSIVKDPKRYPDFDEVAAADLRTALDVYLRDTAGSKTAGYQEMMTSPTVVVNGRLAKFYGVSLPADAPFQRVSAPDRAGVLTQPYMMSRLAYLEGSSPIHRGVLVARNMMGRVLAPPPQAFVPFPASSHPGMTTRERVTLQTKPPACTGCHSLINPLGFSFERYDAIGRVRTQDNGKPVNASGSYQTRGGTTVTFTGASDLAKFIATNPEPQAAFVEKLFQYVTKQPVRAFGAQTLPKLQSDFQKGNYNIRKLMVDSVVATVPVSTKVSEK